MARRTQPQDQAAREWADAARAEVLECRTFGHLWVAGVRTIYKLDGFYIRQLGCGRCGMVRRDATPIGQYGAVRRQYIPPPDYRRETTEGTARVPRYLVAEALTARAEIEEPSQDVLDWHFNRNRRPR